MKIQNMSAINNMTWEGRYLMGAIAILTTTPGFTHKTPDQVLERIDEIQAEIFEKATPIPEPVHQEKDPFPLALAKLINQYSLENGSNTPDFILANFLVSVLTGFDEAVTKRSRWYGLETPGMHHGKNPQGHGM